MWGGDKAGVIALARALGSRGRRSSIPITKAFLRVGQEMRWFPSSAGAAGGGAGLAALPLPDPGVGADHQPALPQRPV